MGVKDRQRLKYLQTSLTELETTLPTLKEKAQVANQNYSRAQNDLAQLKHRIKTLQNKEVIVSEHALLRYIERVMGVDLEEIKNQVLGPETLALIGKLGNGKYPIGNGVRAVVKNNTVVTIQ
jgi:septation ring formation regulator EzrA